MQQRVLVTGGTGFIGSHLVEALVARGYQVTVLYRQITMAKQNLKQVLNCIDLCKVDLVAGLQNHTFNLNHFDIIFHLAGSANIYESIRSPEIDYTQNLKTTFYLLDNLRRTEFSPKLIFCSSAAVYGTPIRMPIKESDPTVPISPYGISKLAAEHYLSVYSRLYGLRVASLRLFSVFGPRQTKQVIYDFMQKLQIDPLELIIRGGGNQERDFIYVDNVVDAMLTVVDRAPMQGEAYNVASGESISISKLAGILCKITGMSPQITYTGKPDPGQPHKWSVDISRIKNLGFIPTIKLEEGISNTYEWFQKKDL